MKGKIKLRNTLRKRLIVVGLFFLISIVILSLVFTIGNFNKVEAIDTNGDIRSIASGNWNNLAIWQKYSGSSWIAATSIPSNVDNIITIQNGHTVTITAALTVDQLTVNAGAVLVLNSGITLTLKKAAIPDINVYGIFRNAGVVSIAGGTMITYYNGGKYQHNYTNTAGTIPVGVWNTGSVCEIMGYTTNTVGPSGLNQVFSELLWNCTSQSTNVNLEGRLSTLTGNLTVASTGISNNELQLANNNLTLSVKGDITVTGGKLNCNNASSKSITINQTGNFSITGGTFLLTSGNNCSGTINLTGYYCETGGTFNFGVGDSSVSTLNISGDFTHTGGTMLTTGIGSMGNVVFNKAGSQSFTSFGNTVSGNVNYIINSGSTLHTGTSAMLGNNFTLEAGGELGIGSPDGITSSGFLGNIQVSGIRSYSSGGNYLYNGITDQNTGNGLPTTINKLSISNNNFLCLTNSTAVSNVLNFVTGKINTGIYELHITNSSPSAIIGNSISSYVAGNLRRKITSSGTFDFPVGSTVMYELMSVTLKGTSGFTSLLGKSFNAVTNDTLYPLTAVVNGIPMTEMLDYGYWTLIPNGPLTAGSYSIQLNERGYSNVLSNSTYYSLLVRNDPTSEWKSMGIHADNMQSASGGVVTAVRTGLTSFYQYGIALGDYPSFSTSTLIAGTSNSKGAVYLFQDVMRGIDAHIEIVNLFNGATLTEIDNGTSGYNESFQPVVNFPPNTDSYIEWKISFKKANTSIDTTMKKIAATSVDVDGTSSVREYIVATMPTSYVLDGATLLSMSNDSGRYKAMGPSISIPNIDTSRHEIMYQLNYNNVNTFLYRTGANNIGASSVTRQISLFFRSFFVGATNIYALPSEVVKFNAKFKNGIVLLKWKTESEVNNDYFTVERSSDGDTFQKLFNKLGAGNSTTNKNYKMTDDFPLEGPNYYRLKQTDFDGTYTYSNVEFININKSLTKDILKILRLAPNPVDTYFEIEFSVMSKGSVVITILGMDGKIIYKKNIPVNEGNNFLRYEMNSELKAGNFVVMLQQDDQMYSTKFLKN